jgi:L-fuculose-phosphate aldolase
VTRESLVKVRYDETGEFVETQMNNQRYRASSEWRFHRDIYRSRADVSAVVHVHSTYATSLACTGRGIPAFHYMIAIAGGDDVRCARYATYGTQELSDNVINALDGRRACLIENHGMLAIGRSLSDALATAVEVESLAEQYAISLLLGGPRILSDKEMASVHTKFAAYRRLGEQEQS